MSTRIQTEGPVQCMAFQNRDTGRWVGICDELGIVVEGEDLDELHSLFGEALSLLLVDLIEEGDLVAFFRDRGWTDTEEIDPSGSVPWNLVASGESDGPKRRVA